MKKDSEYQIGVIKSSKHFHEKWYQEIYPDVKYVGLSPAEHFYKYGAPLGRNPGKFFDTKYYQDSYPDVKKSGLNPLVHYILFGEKEGRQRNIKKGGVAKQKTYKLRKQLLSLGFSEKALEDLKENLSAIEPLRSLSAKELALYSMRKKTKEGYLEALNYIDLARKGLFSTTERANLHTIEILAFFMLDEIDKARASYKKFISAGRMDPDVLLAASNIYTSSTEKIEIINQVFELFGLYKINLINNSSAALYDTMSRVPELLDVSAPRPLISILIAAYNAENTIETTIRSLQEQTWKNIEILVLDDCSSDGTKNKVQSLSNNDNRIKFVQMERNGGAYAARNKGLLLASGEYVTIHDADDWSHPQKLEIQCEYLLKSSSVIGCTSQQARADNNLNFLRWTGEGRFIITNTSSFMFKRKEVLETVGGWDTVRFSADNELIRRIRKIWGHNSIVHLKTGPLSFQRDSETSVVAHAYYGINGAHFGVRKEYLEAQEYHHNNSSSLHYSPEGNKIHFPTPSSMRGTTTLGKDEQQKFDVIIASDFRMPGGSVLSCVEEIKAQKKAGLKTGLIQLYRYDLNVDSHMLPEVREQVDGQHVQVLTYGESAECDVLIVRYPPVLQYFQEFVPKIDAKIINVIVNQPPMSEYSGQGVKRYSIQDCAKNVKRIFGKSAVWYPIGPAVREILNERHFDELQLIDLADEDWVNIIDIDAWAPEKRKVIGDINKIAVGRHARDNYVKWPSTKNELLKAYPESEKFAVKILGGADVAIELIGHLPRNWTVYRFGELSPRQFLKELDFFVYYTHPDWVESFGRSILEALAAGIPTILPESYKSLFSDAAIYASVDNVIDVVERISTDDYLYQKMSENGIKYVRMNYSYETHCNRLLKCLI